MPVLEGLKKTGLPSSFNKFIFRPAIYLFGSFTIQNNGPFLVVQFFWLFPFSLTFISRKVVFSNLQNREAGDIHSSLAGKMSP